MKRARIDTAPDVCRQITSSNVLPLQDASPIQLHSGPRKDEDGKSVAPFSASQPSAPQASALSIRPLGWERLPSLPEKRWPASKLFESWFDALKNGQRAAERQEPAGINPLPWLPDEMLKLIIDRLEFNDERALALSCRYHYQLLQEKGLQRLPLMMTVFMHGKSEKPSQVLLNAVLALLAPANEANSKKMEHLMRDRLRAVLLLGMASTAAGGIPRNSISPDEQVMKAVQDMKGLALTALTDLLDYYYLQKRMSTNWRLQDIINAGLANVLRAVHPLWSSVPAHTASSALLHLARRLALFNSDIKQATNDIVKANPSLLNLHIEACLKLNGVRDMGDISGADSEEKLHIARACLTDLQGYTQMVRRLLREQETKKNSHITADQRDRINAALKRCDGAALLADTLVLSMSEKAELIANNLALVKLEIGNLVLLEKLRWKWDIPTSHDAKLRSSLERSTQTVSGGHLTYPIARQFGELTDCVIAAHPDHSGILEDLHACAKQWPDRAGGATVLAWFKERTVQLPSTTGL